MTYEVETTLCGPGAYWLLDELARIPHERYDQLCLSLRTVEAIDVTGVCVLVRLHSQLSARGKRLALQDTNEAVRRTLDEIGLSSVIPVRTDPRSTSALLRLGRESPPR